MLARVDPNMVKRAALLLMEGRVDSKKWTVFEAHIPYEMHFFSDYNLAGMNYIDISWPNFRSPLPQSAPSTCAVSQPQRQPDARSAPNLKKCWNSSAEAIPLYVSSTCVLYLYLLLSFTSNFLLFSSFSFCCSLCNSWQASFSIGCISSNLEAR